MSITGLKIVITGTFSRPRKEIEADLERLGADVTSAISGKTRLLIAGPKGGRKLAKAESLGLPIIDEAQMQQLLAGKSLEELLGAPDNAADSAADKPPKQASKTPPLSDLQGTRIVLTGEFSFIDRSAAKRKLQALGAKVTGAVSGKTDVLIAGAEAGQSKLGRARDLRTPVVGESQLKMLLEGAALALAITSEDEEPADVTDFPAVIPRPRDGIYREAHPGTDIMKSEGELKRGKREGPWKGCHPNGAAWWNSTYQNGLREGQGRDWHDNGKLACEGVWSQGKRQGAWTWWYASGAFKQSYIYDAGKKHGVYVWDQEDGTPRAHGEFWQDRRHGDWEWFGEPKHERVSRGHDRGVTHGQSAAWFHGGQLAYRQFFEQGMRVGSWEEYFEDGRPKSKIAYERGLKVGAEHTWDASGEETVQVYVRGLPESLTHDDKKLDKIVAKVRKARDEYRKQDAIGDACEYSERGALLMHLWRTGKLDVSQEPALWEMLESNWELVSANELLGLLSVIDKVGKDVHCGHLPSWPSSLDRLVAQVYVREPEPIDAAWKDLPAKMRVGVAFVLARAGKDVGKALSRQLGALAKKHVRDGLGDRIPWWIDGDLSMDATLYDVSPIDHRREPNERFYDLIELFGTRDAWATAVLAQVVAATKKEHNVPWDQGKDGLAIASVEQLVPMLDASGYERIVASVFTRWRDDDGDTLVQLAVAAEKGRGKVVANCAAVKLTAEGKPIPDELLEVIELDVGSGSLSWVDERIHRWPDEDARLDPAVIDELIAFDALDAPGFPESRLLFEALRALTADQHLALFERQIEDKYGKQKVAPILFLFDDPDIWKRGLNAIDASSYGAGHGTALGLGTLPKAALPMLDERRKATKNKELQETYRRAMLLLMARIIEQGETWDEQLDSLIRTGSERYDYPNIMPLLRKIVHRLPAERAENVLLANLDTRSRTNFCRAVRFIGSHPTGAVLRKAFAGIRALEASMKQQDQNEVRAGLSGLFDKRRWIAWMLRNGGGAGLKSTFEGVLGHKDYEKLLAEIKEEGVEAPKELDAIGKLVLRAGKSKAAATETVYLLRRQDAVEGFNCRGGMPPGIGGRWPMRDDEPMVHLFTLDLGTMPALAAQYPGKKTMSMFCANPDMNEAYEPYNSETAIVFSDAGQLAKEFAAPDDVELRDAGGFEVVAVQVPSAVWWGDDDLKGDLYGQSARVMGSELWLQEDGGGGGGFVMQFDEGFVDINLGDGGVMYVYGDTAFWQCH